MGWHPSHHRDNDSEVSIHN